MPYIEMGTVRGQTGGLVNLGRRLNMVSQTFATTCLRTRHLRAGATGANAEQGQNLAQDTKTAPVRHVKMVEHMNKTNWGSALMRRRPDEARETRTAEKREDGATHTSNDTAQHVVCVPGRSNCSQACAT